MKKFLGILVLGIGIVLSIPKSVQAVGTCNVTVDGSYGFPNKIHYCTDNNVMEISVKMERNWALADLNTNTANNVSITITATGSMLSNKSGAATITGNGTDGATIINAGTVRAGINTINFNTGTNVTITNQSGGVIKAEHATLDERNTAIKANGTGFTLNNSGDITATGINTILTGENSTIINNSGGTIQGDRYGINGTGTNSGTSSTITNSGNIYGTTNRAIYINGSNYTITNQSGGLIRAGSDGSTNTS
ncbi:uncharacterized protein METZ01_LOCUS421692, partial [marine metagenome]